jgi:2-polyprenyl-6-methoxyphenol hydroxylase-like FAD-dependent oxidoreductase
MRGGVRQLHRWGLLPRVIAAGTPAVRSTTFHLPGGVSTLDIKPKHGVDALYAPRRTVLDAVLVDAARNAGADVRFGTSVTCLRRDRSGRVTGITGRTGAARLEVGADLVVGADGRRSAVARHAGAGAARVAPASSGVIYQYFHGVAADGYHWYFTPGSAAGVIPTNDGLACVFAATGAESLGRELDGGAGPACGASWTGRRRGWRTGSSATPRPARRACSPVCAGTCVTRRDPGGRWSGTPAISRIRSPPTASPTRFVTPRSWRAWSLLGAPALWPAIRRNVTSFRGACSA